jgi:iron complex outermembrane receptor protein
VFGGLLDYSAGVYYFWQHNREHTDQGYGSAAGAWYLSPINGVIAPSDTLNTLKSQGDISSTTNSYSGFASGTYHMAPDLNLTGGLRYTYEVKNGTFNSYQFDSIPISSLPSIWQASATSLRSALAPTTAYSAQIQNGAISGTVNLSYRFNEEVFAYASYSRGFKGAGLNLVSQVGTAGISPTVAPETVDAYEIGVKTNLFDNRLAFNANLFLENAANYQATSYTIINGVQQQFIGNVGQVRSQGVEVDARAILYEGLTAQFAATYDDGIYVSYPRAQCPYLYSYGSTCNLSGAPLSGLSRLTFFAGTEYQHLIGNVDAHEFGFYKLNQQNLIGYIGGDVSYRSSFLSALNDDPFSRIPAYSLFGLHAGARTEDGNLNVSLWVRNLTNKTYLQQIAVGTSGATGIGVATAILGDPRFFGMTMTAKF